MSSFTGPEFIDELVTALEGNSDLTALTSPVVNVFGYYPSVSEDSGDSLIIGHTVSDNNDPAAMGQKRFKEAVTVACEIRIIRAGAGKVVAKAARDRAAAIMSVVHEQLTTGFPNVGDQTISARATNRELLQFPSESGTTPVRVALLAFDIEYEARTRP